MELRRRKSAALSPSNSMLVPYVRRRLVESSSPKIPAGWGVEEVPRRNGTHSDRYYYEPGTGKKFRSIREVDDYLNGGKLGHRRRRSSTRKSTYNSPKHRRRIVSGGKLLKLDEVNESQLAMVPYVKPSRKAPFILPDGWVVEEVPRRYDPNWADKYYYEPGTERRFRSLAAVERHLAELEENAPLSEALEEIKENIPLSKVFKLESVTKNSKKKAPEENAQASSFEGPPMEVKWVLASPECENSKKKAPEENAQISSFEGPPMEVKWVLASPEGDAWNAYISEELIPDDVKKQWTNKFMLFMNQGNK